jgi:pimeloyl-ACP methyl ester carboxylesterase
MTWTLEGGAYPVKQKDKVDISFIEGKKNRPLVIFIHGLGMDKTMWTDPGRSKVLAGRYPLSILLQKKASSQILDHKPVGLKKITTGIPPKELITVFHQLRDMDFNVLAWSQKRPASHAKFAVSELSAIVREYSDPARNGIITVGHSRGGLIAKSYALSNPDNIRAIISIGSPFRGSSLARWADIVSRTLSVTTPFFNNTEKGTVKSTIKHVLDFINSMAVKELLPGSEFLDTLISPVPRRIRSLSIAGSSPNLLNIYNWYIDCIDKSNKYKLRPKLLFSFPDSVRKVLPDVIVPDELIKGRGDGLVSVNSATSDLSHKQGIYPYNHAGLLFSRTVRKNILDFILRETR